MLRLLYSLILFLLLPLLVFRLIFKSMGVPGYRHRIGERFASFTPPAWDNDKPVIWIHAVSVGEVVAAAPLINELTQLGLNIAVTTTTPTGSDRVKNLFPENVFHVYVPYDLGFLVRRFLNKVNPQLLIIMETELWPNMLHQCPNQGVKSILANGRLSEKSAAGYRRFSGLSKSMLGTFNCIAAQAEADARRFVDLGADENSVSVTGSLKFYIENNSRELPDAIFTSVRDASRPVLIAASTRDGEEEKVLDAFKSIQQSNEQALLVLVPRHPERFDKVNALAADAGFTIQRRSNSTDLKADTAILLGDSMGEMNAYYQLATIAFVGGSLVDTGCQNVIEPAAIGLPVVVGPSQFNFATICQQLETAGALITVPDSSGLAQTVNELLGNESMQQQMGEAGKQLVAENQRALPMLMDLIRAQIKV